MTLRPVHPARGRAACWPRLSSLPRRRRALRIVSLAAAAQTSMQPELLGTLTRRDANAMLCCALPYVAVIGLWVPWDMVQMVSMLRTVVTELLGD